MAHHVSAHVDLVPVRSASTEPQLQTDSQEPTGNENKPFRFLDLPPELRNKIYEIHLAEEGVVTITRRRVSLTTPTLGVNLLRCCRQIYNEAASYVERSGWLAMELKTIIDNWQVHNTLQVHVFNGSSPLFRDPSSRMLAYVVNLRLDIPVCSHKEPGIPPALPLQNMKSLEHVDTYFRLQGCFGSRHIRRRLHARLVEWLNESHRTKPGKMVTRGLFLDHRHDDVNSSSWCRLLDGCAIVDRWMS